LIPTTYEKHPLWDSLSELRPFFNLFRSKEVGVQLVDIGHIADALQDAGLDERVEISALPTWLRTEKARHQLRRELALLLKRQRKPDEQKSAERRLARCAVVPGRDKALWPCQEVYWADEETIALFTRIDPQIAFLAQLEEEADELQFLCPEFTPPVAVDQLARVLVGTESAPHPKTFDPAALLGWFEDRREDVLRSSSVKHGLAALPVFPCSEGFKPLSTLSLPGDFADPIGLAGVVDLIRLKGRRDFLRELGARELTFPHYAADHVPRAFRLAEVTPEHKRNVVRLLAERLGEIRDDEEVGNALADIPIVECDDEVYRRPEEVYFDNDVVRVVLGDEVPLAVVPKDHEASIRDLYRWLGVAKSPRFEAITRRIKVLTASPPNQDSVDAVGIIFRHLSKRLGNDEKSNSSLMELRSLAWLPARGDRRRWYRPGDLHAIFQDYLFESQAKFLDLPRDVQTSSGELLSFLLVKTKPTTRQVVDHLLHCAGSGAVVNKEVYRFLNDNADDGSLNLLQNKLCLLLPDNTYVKASQVFWGEHPFGSFRHRLGPDLRKYGELFARLGVRETPDYRDAFQVLKEISIKYGSGNHLLRPQACAIVIACWQRLERALLEGLVQPDELAALSGVKVVPDVRHLLNPPEWMFFEDRAGLAAKFKHFLQNNVIAPPQGARRAMAEAGVRLLSSAVRTHLVECRNPVADDSVTSRLQERRRQLLRVLESQDEGNGHLDLTLLDQIQCRSVEELKIQYSVTAFNRKVRSDSESLPAKFQPEERVLYLVRRGGDVPWTSVARELALALSPEADPGRLAAGINIVLAAATEESAGASLDELGFAPLEMAPEEPLVGPPIIQELGGASTIPEATEVSPATHGQTEKPIERPAPGDRQPDTPGQGDAGQPRDGQETRLPEQTAPSAEDTITRTLGPGTAKPTPPPDLQKRLQSRPEEKEGRGSRGTGEPGDRPHDSRESRDDRRERRTASRGQGRLRTYVSPEPCEEEREEDPDRAAERDAVERAGVDCVLKYEADQKRHPKEMAPNHPGYDIESSKDAGGVERYIEVKSLSGDWGSLGAALSDTQFEKASELGDRYWLYVVERAKHPDYRIYRIQDPARKVNQFIYDDGWQALAEGEEYQPSERK
ncbi:MAG: DUF3883 domain-containing protein, partial [Gemmataceae bacterium]|nr:DUF3883 domain-containing protein [Gemmataceae bacterium]